MKVIYYKSPRGNFGDDLNPLLWREVLPPACFDIDDVVLLGIGSIFRDDFLSPPATVRKRVFVLGSGAGTGPLPSQWPNSDWSILAVRGPLTGRLIGMPDKAITDSAALLATTPALKPEVPRSGRVVFMPHYNSVAYSRWPEICEEIGFDFIDAHWPVERTLKSLAGASLVMTEAMHGAIVADTLRVPWIPVACSPEVAPFKWIDWTQSLDLDYRPVSLPPSSAWEALKHFKIRAVDGAKGLEALSDDDEDLFADFNRRYGQAAGADLTPARIVPKSQAGRLQKITALFDPFFAERATRALISASKGQSYLSKDTIFLRRVDQLQQAVAQLERALLGTAH